MAGKSGEDRAFEMLEALMEEKPKEDPRARIAAAVEAKRAQKHGTSKAKLDQVKEMMNTPVPGFEPNLPGLPTPPPPRPVEPKFPTAADKGYVWEGKEQCLKELAEARDRYNKEEVPKIKQRMDEAFAKLPENPSTEQVLDAAFGALGEECKW